MNKKHRHEIFQIFGRFQIILLKILISKVIGFYLKVTKTLFWRGGVGSFRLFMACFRFFHAELSLMPENNRTTTLERTAALQGLKYISTGQIFILDSTVVKTQTRAQRNEVTHMFEPYLPWRVGFYSMLHSPGDHASERG